MPRIDISKDWCLNMAKLIGAGLPNHPLRAAPAVTVTELRLIAKQLGPIDRDLVEAAADEIERLRKLLLNGVAIHGGEAHTHSEKEWRAEARRALGIGQ